MRRVSLLVLAIGMFSLGGGLIGQDKKDAKKEETKVKEGKVPQGWGKANLGLTDVQEKKIREIDSKATTEIDALKKKIDDLQKKRQEDQVAVLTAEQKKKLEDYFKSKAGTDK